MGQMYVYGNVVTKPSYEPDRREGKPQRKRRAGSRTKSYRRAKRLNVRYLAFLTVAAVITLVACVNYVKLQSRITSRSEEIAALQQEFADIKEENNTRYHAVMDSVNLDEVKKTAEETLGMVYATADQVVEYENPSTDYVKQYENIPEDGVIAQSDKNTD